MWIKPIRMRSHCVVHTDGFAHSPLNKFGIQLVSPVRVGPPARRTLRSLRQVLVRVQSTFTCDRLQHRVHHHRQVKKYMYDHFPAKQPQKKTNTTAIINNTLNEHKSNTTQSHNTYQQSFGYWAN